MIGIEQSLRHLWPLIAPLMIIIAVLRPCARSALTARRGGRR